ncbi:nitrous oxide reductase accessory protein NosL [Reinekea sp. G2M2-21]|uniref:nitrous oxide reductase accessory protein NosL n=1 Tax=Reinekea sp. G2M2-21 TaxID=2788942 RepID=UPI0018A90A6E|nr:nitrous oxide reductase accessory protein NosL [Reinekea sp. G2M2-21]
MSLINKSSKASAVLIAMTLLMSCQSSNPTEAVLSAAAIEGSDQCHLCGMVISGFEGPKGELISKGDNEVQKFCSTRDLFGFYLQPENQHRAIKIYVHDMSVTPWASPDDEHFIDAQSAYFVWGANRFGAMGETLGSFSKQVDAQAFADEYGGQILRFDEITLEMLTAANSMDMGMPMHSDVNSPMVSGMSVEQPSMTH